jgi:hypothetical protein
MYVRVFSSILDSSIWQEELHVRCLWLVLLIMADESRDGTVNVPIARLAQKAALTEEQTRNALEILMAPDEDSDSPDEEGRRIVPLIPERPTRGWRLVNWKKYKDISNAEQRREQVKENMRRYRAKDSRVIAGDQALSTGDHPVIPSDSTSPSSSPEENQNLFPPASPPERKKTRAREKSAKELIEEHEISDEERSLAKSVGVDVESCHDDWRDHFRGNGYLTSGKPVKDACATFRRWLRTAGKLPPRANYADRGQPPFDRKRPMKTVPLPLE